MERITTIARGALLWTTLVLLGGGVIASMAGIAGADELTSKGTVLHGKVTSFNSTGVVFEPEYGKGTFVVKWADVEAVKTDGSFQILHGDDKEIYSSLNGMHAGKLATAEAEIEVATIFVGLPLVDGRPSFRDRMRSRFRYWDGNFDLGFNATQGTVDTIGLVVAFSTIRSKGPLRLSAATSYRYARQKSTEREDNPDPPGGHTHHTEETTLQKEWKGLLRGEYDITPRIYAFASEDLEYDQVERLSLRSVTKAGAGVTVWKEDLTEGSFNFLRTEAGGAYVYEDFFGNDKSDYFAIAFGALAQYHLPLGALFDWRFDYLPNVADWGHDYLLRTEASLTLPLYDPISVKVGVIDQFDNTPADQTDKNSLYFAAGLSVVW